MPIDVLHVFNNRYIGLWNFHCSQEMEIYSIYKTLFRHHATISSNFANIQWASRCVLIFFFDYRSLAWIGSTKSHILMGNSWINMQCKYSKRSATNLILQEIFAPQIPEGLRCPQMRTRSSFSNFFWCMRSSQLHKRWA